MLERSVSVILIAIGFIVPYAIAYPHQSQDPCIHNIWSCSRCYTNMKKGFCTQRDKVQEMKTNCPSMCGYYCRNGKMATGPFNQGCPGEDECFSYDILNHVMIAKYNITKDSCYGLKKSLKPTSGKTLTPAWMKFHCETTFGWCCPDKKTFADGPDLQNCPYKLCYNVYNDEYCSRMANVCNKPTYDIGKKCAWTCNICKAPSPPMCGPYKCCWNNKPPIIKIKPNGEQAQICPPCSDDARYVHVCKQFKVKCNSGQIRVRTFLNTYCYKTCNPGC